MLHGSSCFQRVHAAIPSQSARELSSIARRAKAPEGVASMSWDRLAPFVLSLAFSAGGALALSSAGCSSAGESASFGDDGGGNGNGNGNGNGGGDDGGGGGDDGGGSGGDDGGNVNHGDGGSSSHNDSGSSGCMTNT